MSPPNKKNVAFSKTMPRLRALIFALLSHSKAITVLIVLAIVGSEVAAYSSKEKQMLEAKGHAFAESAFKHDFATARKYCDIAMSSLTLDERNSYLMSHVESCYSWPDRIEQNIKAACAHNEKAIALWKNFPATDNADEQQMREVDQDSMVKYRNKNCSGPP